MSQISELDRRLEDVAQDAAQEGPLAGREYLGLALFTLALPAVLMIAGWYL